MTASGASLAAFIPSATEQPLLWLFVAAHLLGDALLHSGSRGRDENRAPSLLVRISTVVGIHLVVVAPILRPSVLLAASLAAAAHVVVGRAEQGSGHTHTRRIGSFLAVQVGHLTIAATAAILFALRGDPRPHLPFDVLTTWTAVVFTAGVFAFVWSGGDTIVRATLRSVRVPLNSAEGSDLDEGPEKAPETGPPGSGRMIGILERTIALILLLLGEWTALALLLAAKSIARFEELKRREFAEYYLIGTLTSLLVAILAGVVLTAVWAAAGFP